MSNNNILCNDQSKICDNSNQEKFWLDDFTELYKNGNFLKFIPKYNMSRNQQLNAITRLALLMILILLILNSGEMLLFIPITLIIIVILFKNVNNDPKIANNPNNENFRNQIETLKYDPENDIKYRSFDSMTIDNNLNKNYHIETGYYDSDNDLIMASKNNIPTFFDKQPPSLYKIDDIIDIEKKTCRHPTIDNPFMNAPPTQFGIPDPPAACNVDDDDIKESIKVNFNHDLFRDVGELWQSENSARQFYTTLNSSISNQKEFAMWLYNTGDFNCKGDNQQCLMYDPLFYNRS